MNANANKAPFKPDAAREELIKRLAAAGWLRARSLPRCGRYESGGDVNDVWEIWQGKISKERESFSLAVVFITLIGGKRNRSELSLLEQAEALYSNYARGGLNISARRSISG